MRAAFRREIMTCFLGARRRRDEWENAGRGRGQLPAARRAGNSYCAMPASANFFMLAAHWRESLRIGRRL
jgi:hypothetical protein